LKSRQRTESYSVRTFRHCDSLLNPPVQHVPGEDEPHSTQAREHNQCVTHARCPPTLRYSPGLQRAVDRGHRPQHSEPSRIPLNSCTRVFILVIGTKEFLFRKVFTVGFEVGSTAVKADAWHHRSDAITSAAAFVRISVALIGGSGCESADDWAAISAVKIIFFNGTRILRPVVAT
jgi:hypothetical protein